MKPILTLAFLLAKRTAFADYLLVTRNGNLRANASTESEILEKIHTGDKLITEVTKSNGYWHVRATESTQEGWAYQTLVRNQTGNIDGAELIRDNTVVDIRILDVGALPPNPMQ